MILPFLYALNVVLLTRLWLCYGDSRVTFCRGAVNCLLQCLSLGVFVFNADVLRIAIVVSVLNICAWLIEKDRRGQIFLKRLIILGFYLISFSILFSKSFDVQFRPSLRDHVSEMRSYFLPASLIDKINLHDCFIYLLGLLLCLNEANLFVRYVIETLRLRPAPNTLPAITWGGVSENQEYNRGRIIGLLERSMLFFFILQGQYAVLGFVIAAKTAARFSELDDRDFAEYFIVGTMLSVVTAGIIALLTKNLFL